MASLKFFLLACMLVACVVADVPVNSATPTDPSHGDEQTETVKRDKKDVLLSTLTYPVAQPAVHLLKTVSPISAVNPITIDPVYRTVYPYSYYPYYYPYSYYPTTGITYLRK